MVSDQAIKPAGLVSDSGRMTGNPEVIRSAVGLVPRNALVGVECQRQR